MTAIPAFVEAGKARTAYQDSTLLAQAAHKAMGALQFRMAGQLFTQAADALQPNPHTGQETVQARAYRRSASNCMALVNTNAPMRLLKDAPDYGALQRQHQQQAEEKQRTYWRSE